MKLQLETDKGWTEAIIISECKFSKFYGIADLLSTNFNLSFSTKIHDFDSLYWEFIYKGKHLVLHFNIFLGVSIFPLAFKLATQEDNEATVEISTLLLQKLIDHNLLSV